jgi:hypothetical protein
MLSKLTSVTLVAALLIVSCGTAAFASNSPNPDKRTDIASVPSDIPANKEIKPNEQLKKTILKLVADAKAGKVAPTERPQIRPAQRNNFSKGKKIALGVGIAVAVIAVILIVNSPALNDGQ